MSVRTLRLGGYELAARFLAPLAGYSDIAFRTLAKRHGAGLTVTEMVSVRGLVRSNAATRTLMRTSQEESPSCVQLFGNDPDDFARAAELLDCDVIDVNMGCPMPKIVKNGDGAALLRDPELAGRIVKALKSATDCPITVKTRLGYASGDGQAGELIESVQKAGASLVTLHGRTAEQRYSGASDIEAVGAVAERVNIPIVYNGDVCAQNIGGIERDGRFAAVAIGRAALADPAIFVGGKSDPFELAEEHLALLEKYFDVRYAVNQSRKFFVHYFKGVRGAASLRNAVNIAADTDEIKHALYAARCEYNKYLIGA